MSIEDTPRANRPHIGIYGRRNAGKSSLINALTGQQVSLVSEVAGTTTDPVFKAMELHGLGPVVFIDTAGLDDFGELGKLRVGVTRKAMEKTDVAVVVFANLPGEEDCWIREFQEKKIPVIPVVNQWDSLTNREEILSAVAARYGIEPLAVSTATGENIDVLRQSIASRVPDRFWDVSITGSLAQENDTVLLVMPQDIEAPQGRLILPQVQTIRELLDKHCVVMSCTVDRMDLALGALARPPKLIITDSQVFPEVYRKKPEESLFTSFSVLFAGYKGDIAAFLKGAEAIGKLGPDSRVLIAEACAHAPTSEDIGREKIPKLLRKKAGQSLTVDFVRGNDFPEDLTGYDLIIHCGACMFTRRHVLSRIARAEAALVPICNYGITIACLTGIMDKVSFPSA